MANNYGEFGLDNARLKRDVEEAQNAIKGIGRTAQNTANDFDSAFKRAGQLAAGYFSIQAAAGFVSQLVQVRGEFQKLEVGFTTMLGSKEKSNQLMAQMVDTAMKTPFTLQEVAGGAKQLLAYQIAQEDVNKTLIQLGNISAGLGVPLSRLILVYGQVKAKGRLMGDDLRQFTEAGVPIIHELAKQMGIADSEVQKLVSSGKVGFPEVQKVIENMTGKGGMFFDLMAAQSKTVTGQLSNLEDAWSKMLNQIGAGNEGLIYSAIGGVSSLITNYETVGKVMAGVIATMGVYKAALLISTFLENKRTAALVAEALAQSYVTESMGMTTIAEARTMVARTAGTASIYSQIIAQLGLNAAIMANPYVLATIGVIALGTAIWAFSDHTTTAEKATKRLTEATEAQEKKEADLKSATEDNINTVKNTSLIYDERKAALLRLSAAYHKIFAQYKTEKEQLEHILDIAKQINEEQAKKSGETKAASLTAQRTKVAQLTKEQKEFQAKHKGHANTDIQAALDTESEVLRQMEAKASKQRSNDYFINLKNETDEKINAQMGERERLIHDLEKAEKAGDKTKKYGTVQSGGAKGSFTKDELKAQNDTFRAELNQRGIDSKLKFQTVNQDLAQYNKDLAKLIAERAVIVNKNYKTAGVSDKDALALRNKALTDKDAEIDVKKAQIKTKSGESADIKKEQSKADKLRKEADKELSDYKESQLDQQKTLDAEELAYQKSLISDKESLIMYELSMKLKAIEEKRKLSEQEAKKTGGKYDGTVFEKRATVATNQAKREVAQLTKSETDALIEIAKKYQEERKQIETDANAEIEKLRKGGFAAEAKAAVIQRDSKISTLTSGLIEETDAYKLATGEQLLISKDTTARLIADIKARIKAAQSDPDLSKRLSKADGDRMLANLEKAEYTVNKTDNPFMDLIKGLADYKKAREEASKSNADTDIANFARLEDAANRAKRLTLEATAGALQGIGSIIKQVTDEIQGLSDAEKKTIDEVQNIIQGAATLAQGIATENPVSIVQGSVQLLVNLYAVLDTTTKNRNALIEAEKAKVLELSAAYESLSDAISNAYGQRKAKLITDQIANLEEQKKSLEAQKQAELSKDRDKPKMEWWEYAIPGYNVYKLGTVLLSPSTDPKAVAKYEADIAAITKRQEELTKLAIVEALTGTTVSSAIDQFADAYANAFTKGEDAAAASAEIVRNLILTALGERLRDELQPEIEALMTLIANAMSPESDGGTTLTDAEKKIIEAKRKAIDDLAAKRQQDYKGIESGGEVKRTATAKGVESMSQQSADELNGRFTAIQGHTFQINESVKILALNSPKVLATLMGIKNDTARLENIETGIYKINTGIDTLNIKGVTVKMGN